MKKILEILFAYFIGLLMLIVLVWRVDNLNHSSNVVKTTTYPAYIY